MSIDSPSTNDRKAFVDASLTHVRLVSLRAKSDMGTAAKEGQQVQLRTDTSSSFSVGLDSLEKPTAIAITIQFKASIKLPETEQPIVEYESKHEGRFEIVSWTGFNWPEMPPDAMSSYLANMHNIAQKKAEEIILDMGLKGVTLPKPDNFRGSLTPKEA